MASGFDSESEYGNFFLILNDDDGDNFYSGSQFVPEFIDFEDDDAELVAIVDMVEEAEMTMDLAVHVQNSRQESPKETPSDSARCRFPSVTEAELAEIEENAASKGTKQQTAWGVKLFRQWLTETGHDNKFEQLEVEGLDELLRQFYASVRSSNGTLYSKSTFVGLRASINRHLRAPPYSKIFNILNDAAFHKSNNMFKAMLKKLKREGLDTTKHHRPISQSDLDRLRSSGVLSISSPRSLQRKVWFDVTISFARRGRENLRELKSNSFEFKTDDSGLEYVEMSYNEATKNHPGDDLKDHDFESKPRMYSTGDLDTCPVLSLKKYLSKRNGDNDIFFQQPKTNFNPSSETWYTCRPVGQRTLNDMMKAISSDARLSTLYTNHCVRATTITLLSHAGIEAREIMRISGHRNESSIRSYNSDSSDQQKRHYSSIIHGNKTSSALVPEHQVNSSTNTSPPVPSPALAPISVSAAPNICTQTNINNNLLIPTPQIPYQKQFEVYNSTINVYNYYGQ